MGIMDTLGIMVRMDLGDTVGDDNCDRDGDSGHDDSDGGSF